MITTPPNPFGAFSDFPGRVSLLRVALIPLLTLSLTAEPGPLNEWMRIQTISPGTEVRIESSGARTVSGHLQSVSDDDVAVDDGQSRHLARQQVTRVLVKTKSRRGVHVLIGAGIGAGAGAVAGIAADRLSNNSPVLLVVSRTEKTAIATGFGAVVGGVIGAITGALLPAGWETVYKR